MIPVIQVLVMTLSIIAIAITIITDLVLAFLIRKKVRRNHFKNRLWHPILTTLAAYFLIEGIAMFFDLAHQIVHSFDYVTVHWWFLIGYILKAVATGGFFFILKAYSGAFDSETKEV